MTKNSGSGCKFQIARSPSSEGFGSSNFTQCLFPQTIFLNLVFSVLQLSTIRDNQLMNDYKSGLFICVLVRAQLFPTATILRETLKQHNTCDTSSFC